MLALECVQPTPSVHRDVNLGAAADRNLEAGWLTEYGWAGSDGVGLCCVVCDSDAEQDVTLARGPGQISGIHSVS